MALPPDRGDLSTEEQQTAVADISELAIDAFVEFLVDDHAAVITAVRAATSTLTAFIAALLPRIRSGGRLIYLGAGTSGRLGVLDASECPPTFSSEPGQILGVIAGGDAALRTSSEGMEDDPDGALAEFTRINLNHNDTVLGIAAGGSTPYVRGGIGLAHDRNAMTGLLTCARNVTPPRGCDHLIAIDTGAEVIAGSTRLKAGTATKLALNIITTTLFVQLGKTWRNLMVDLRPTNAKLHDRGLRVLLATCPTLSGDRAKADALLNRAGRNIKVAIVMHHANMTNPADAAALLHAHNGHIHAAIAHVSSPS
ncbi:MAG: N-acetylmuramic acid 6-phosphate etherase [Phycisphaerales bacterium]